MIMLNDGVRAHAHATLILPLLDARKSRGFPPLA